MSVLEPDHRPDWKAGLWIGLVAGTIFLLLEMFIGAPMRGYGPWVVPRKMAAIVLGPGVLPPPETFDVRIFIVAMVVHYALSLIYATVGVALLYRFRPIPATILGALLGLLLYGINFYGFAAWFPWFAEIRDWFSATVHAIFGAVHGCGCKIRLRKKSCQL